MSQNTKMLLGALVAAALAAAVYYGLIGQQTASNIQSQANQTLGTAPAQQTAPTSQTTTPTGPAPSNAAPQPQPQH